MFRYNSESAKIIIFCASMKASGKSIVSGSFLLCIYITWLTLIAATVLSLMVI